jgi:16S rRNA processing protein RimM
VTASSTRREVGRIGRPHGVRGDLYVSLVSDRTERLAAGAVLHAGERQLVVATSTPAGNRWRVHFEGVDDRTAAEALVSAVLTADPLDDGDSDELWVHQLVGSRVLDQHGVDRGECVAVVDNPAHDLLELDSGFLVPVVFVVSCRSGVTRVEVPEGLFDPA